MTPSNKISFIFEAIAAKLYVLKEDYGQQKTEAIIGKRVLYWMKKTHLAQMTNGEFYQFTGISFANECRTVEEMTAIEKILFDPVNTFYLKLISEARHEDQEYYELMRAS